LSKKARRTKRAKAEKPNKRTCIIWEKDIMESKRGVSELPLGKKGYEWSKPIKKRAEKI